MGYQRTGKVGKGDAAYEKRNRKMRSDHKKETGKT